MGKYDDSIVHDDSVTRFTCSSGYKIGHIMDGKMQRLE